jgi:hypothetical protein
MEEKFSNEMEIMKKRSSWNVRNENLNESNTKYSG